MSNEKQTTEANQPEAAIDTARLLGVRAHIDSLISQGFALEQRYSHEHDFETFTFIDLDGQKDDYSISQKDWEWVKETYKYTTDESERNIYSERIYSFA